MRIFAAVLCCSLAVLAVNSAQGDERAEDEPVVGDTLQSALNAVSRRRLQIVDNEPAYFGLNTYRYPKEDADGMPFLSDDTGFNEDGQPENIGYGFQKSVAGGVSPGVYASQLASETDDALLTELALEYLDAEMKHDNEDQFYPSVNDAEKRSVFREREMPERSAGAKSHEDVRKRGGGGAGAPLPSSFRERAHDGDENENQRHRLAESVIRRMEEEREEAEAEAEDQDQEYEKLIENLLERYGGSSRNEVDIGKLSAKELGQLLEFLGENGASMADIEGVRAEVTKRYGSGNGYGAGYDFFNNGATMNGGFGYKKRSKQQLDEADAAENAFLFSLKFVSPDMNRETVEQMRENEGIDPSSENDFDISKLSMKYMDEDEKARAEGWLPALEEQEHEEYENLDTPQGLMPMHEASRKRNKQAPHHNIPSEYLLPERHIDKKFLYDRALLKRKRFPVSKRSSNFYTSPPLLHHHVGGERKKKDAPEPHGTDPKVASEISQIFSTDDNSNDNVKIAPQIIGNHVVTKQKAMPSGGVRVVPTTSTTTTTTTESHPERYEQHTQTVIEDRPNDEEIELPVTMSRLEIPIEVKKKSIDWSDYFGLDRRRKKTGPNDGLPSNAGDKDWLMNQYYKTLALSANPNKRVSLYHSNNEMKHKKTMSAQPFDTRIFDSDIFQRNEAKKSRLSEGDDTRIENMDSKLSNLEDLIVNEALKYTGAHQGTTDSREIQEVKDKVMTRLAAAYNLEKMRRALGEFKSSLTAQKMSKFNPSEQEERKRVAIKKERADDRNQKDKKNGKRRSDDEYITGFAPSGRNEGSFGEIVEGPVVDAMSEGYMGGLDTNRVVLDPGECPILANIAMKCQTRIAEHKQQSLLPLCALHQICYICGAQGDTTACDRMFAKKAQEVCADSGPCGETAVRIIGDLTGRMPMDVLYGMPTQCWESFCSAQPMTTNKQA